MGDVIEAGSFGVWLQQMIASLRGKGGTDVPCGECVGCCISGYPVPLRSTDALEDVVPHEQVLVMSPSAKMLLALPDGTCPMLKNRQCSIYERRPETCRDYDCRIFAAAGIDAGGPERKVINERVRAWRFTYETPQELRVHDAIKAAATFIRQNGAAFAGGAPTAATGSAVLAVKSFALFLGPQTQSLSTAEIARAIVAASRDFDRGSVAACC